MTLLDFLHQLSTQGAELLLVDGSLKLKAPKGAVSAEQIAQLKALKSDLLAYFEQLGIHSSRQVERLSYTQQRLWMIEKINPQPGQYNMPALVEIDGQLNMTVLQNSLNQLLRRHHILRTVYRTGEEGMGLQVITERDELPLQCWDLMQQQGDGQAQAWQTLCHEQAAKPFDLSDDLMLRADLIKLSPQRHILLLNMHHIASDGWSRSIIVNELAQLYRAQVDTDGEGAADLAPLKLQYADYAHWQHQWFAGEQLERQLTFWQNTLKEMPWVHNLPLDRPRQEQQDFSAGHYQHVIKKATLEGLERLAEGHQATLFMVLHCAFSLLMHRHSGDTDIIVGTPVANREDHDLAPLVGFFANTLILRLKLNGEQTFAQLLEQGKRYLLDAFDHQQMPFEKLVETLNPPRDISHSPLVQVMLSFQNRQDAQAMDITRFELPQLNMRSLPLQSQVAKFDILLNVQQTQDGLALSWEYAKALFDEPTIAAMAEHFTRLLEEIVVATDQSVAALPLLSESQYQRMVCQWNRSHLAHDYHQCLHELFIQAVAKFPNKTAVVDEFGQMSYLALFAQAKALSEQLLVLAVAPQQLVAVRLAKGRQQLVATLAVMMAGGAYLPLERDWPAQRCQEILTRSQTKLVIAQAGDDLDTRELTVVTVEPVETQAQESLDSAALLSEAAAFSSRQQPNDLAYVIFTSGSTGTPKGVAIEHASAVNTLLDINAQYQIDCNDRVLAVSALSFDLSVYDFFGLLAVGGTVVFPDDKQTKNPQHWLTMVERESITLWNSVPTSAGLLVDQLALTGRISDAPLRVVMMSGDWIDPKLPARLWHGFPGSNLYSLGGATEAAIWSIHYPITSDTQHLRSIPYGKPLNGQSFYILNSQLQHCPVGVTGELFIGGVGVAREYYGQPDLTAKQFIYHEGLQQRLYRTGDQGRYRADGNIEFMGRVDNQLKIRGFRIEPGEIEAQLVKHPNVTKALVLARKDNNDNTHLVAYFSWLEQPSSSAELREFLMGKVPVYMLPSAFVPIERFVLTANGKLDIKALPEFDLAAHQVAYVAPQSECEILLCQMMATLLKCEQVGLDDNFFSLGGHSVLALQLNAMIQEQMAVSLNMTDFFTATSVRRLAEMVEQQMTIAKNQQMAEAQDMNEMVW